MRRLGFLSRALCPNHVVTNYAARARAPGKSSFIQGEGNGFFSTLFHLVLFLFVLCRFFYPLLCGYYLLKISKILFIGPLFYLELFIDLLLSLFVFYSVCVFAIYILFACLLSIFCLCVYYLYSVCVFAIYILFACFLSIFCFLFAIYILFLVLQDSPPPTRKGPLPYIWSQLVYQMPVLLVPSCLLLSSF